ncbi:hypothetical protein PQR14_22125 [Paraburkholderia bryophila]|uniref:hypothetical protein n=1 Tax=Paraburkholderia bryophila TaxID=420952 RepID=UPI0038B77042
MKRVISAAAIAIASIGAHASVPDGWNTWTDAQKQEYNTEQRQVTHDKMVADMAETRGPTECDGVTFHSYWSAAQSERRLADGDEAAAVNPMYANKPAFQDHERKVAAKERSDYERLKAKAMAVCHS